LKFAGPIAETRVVDVATRIKNKIVNTKAAGEERN
jgi:hypothetical protein